MEDSSFSSPEEPFRWGRSDLATFGFFFIATLVGLPLLIYGVLSGLHIDFQPGQLSGVVQILLQGVIDFLLVGCIFFMAKIHGQPLRNALRWIPSKNFHPVLLVVAGAFLAFAVLIVSQLFTTPTKTAFDEVISTPEGRIALAIFGAAVAPFVEEIIFRGFLYTALADVYGIGVAVPVTTLLFAALHVPERSGNWWSVVLILLVGYIFTRVRKRTGSVIPSLIMHTAYNSTILVISAVATLLLRNS